MPCQRAYGTPGPSSSMETHPTIRLFTYSNMGPIPRCKRSRLLRHRPPAGLGQARPTGTVWETSLRKIELSMVAWRIFRFGRHLVRCPNSTMPCKILAQSNGQHWSYIYHLMEIRSITVPMGKTGRSLVAAGIHRTRRYRGRRTALALHRLLPVPVSPVVKHSGMRLSQSVGYFYFRRGSPE